MKYLVLAVGAIIIVLAMLVIAPTLSGVQQEVGSQESVERNGMDDDADLGGSMTRNLPLALLIVSAVVLYGHVAESAG